MITLAKREIPTRGSLDMTGDELEGEWRRARACFDQALVEKTVIDRAYVVAATRLNTLDRLVKQVEQRAAAARRAAAKATDETAKAGEQVAGK